MPLVLGVASLEFFGYRYSRSRGQLYQSATTQIAAREAVQRCRHINTGDEIETLADDFALMGERVLRYHEQLQSELAAKTGEIQRDLHMAREFKESLLPHEYPQLSADQNASPDQSALQRVIEDEPAANKNVSRPLNVTALSHATMKALRDWMQDVPSPDDICLVVVGTEEAASVVETTEPQA